MMRTIVTTVGLGLAFILFFPAPGWGHFLWIVSSSGELRLCFSEGPAPEDVQFLPEAQRLSLWSTSGAVAPASLQRVTDSATSKGWLRVPPDSAGKSLQVNFHYGQFEINQKTLDLVYSARYALAGDTTPCTVNRELDLDLVPRTDGAHLKLQVFHRGERCRAELKQLLEDGKTHVLEPNAEGEFVLDMPTRPLALIAKLIPNDAGQPQANAEGVPAQRRYYGTLYLDVAPRSTPSESSQVQTLPDLPAGLTSFGAAETGDAIYLYGGHRGEPHVYFEASQSGELLRCPRSGSSQWEVVSTGPRLQGLALVSDGRHLYRLGGFEARNPSGKPADLHSVNHFAQFDPQTGNWTDLPPLPEPRSSFDACLHEQTIYVVGGWQLQGEQAPVWHQTAWCFDLRNPSGKWQALPTPPFQRRALSLGCFQGNLVAIGGMDSEGRPTHAVSIYDLQQQTWRAGPNLPDEGKLAGFGSACWSDGRELLATAYDGGLFRLSDDLSSWVACEKLSPSRFFQRLIRLDSEHLAVIGGANMELGSFEDVEILKVKR